MKNLSILFLIIFPFCASAQPDSLAIGGVEKINSLDQKGLKSFRKLKPHFDDFPETQWYFEKKYTPNENRLILFLTITSVSSLIAIVSNPIPDDNYGGEDFSGGQIFGTFFGVGFGCVSIATFGNYLNKRKELVRMYNLYYEYQFGYPEPKINLGWKIDQNGLGLVLTF